jgi:hypothetical protein
MTLTLDMLEGGDDKSKIRRSASTTAELGAEDVILRRPVVTRSAL